MQPTLRLLRQDRALTAVSVLLDVAFHAGRGANGAVAGGGEVADRLGAARRGIEPVFQALSRAGLLEGVRGPRGGYRLARRARDIRLSEAVAAVADGAEGGGDFGGPLHQAVVAPSGPSWTRRCASGWRGSRSRTFFAGRGRPGFSAPRRSR